MRGVGKICPRSDIWQGDEVWVVACRVVEEKKHHTSSIRPARTFAAF